MGLPKIGMILGEGPELCGDIAVAHIGFPEDLTDSPDLKVHLLDQGDVYDALPARPFDGHKGTFGSLLVIAGSVGMSGAAFLTTAAALRSGCGLVYGAFPEKVAAALAAHVVEAIKVPIPGGGGEHLTHASWDALEVPLERASAIALGPGIGTRSDTARLVDEIVCQNLPIVIDADALNCLADKALYLTERSAPTVLTPHPGEMGRLLGISAAEVQADRLGASRKLATDAEVVVLLKGAQTVIAHPDGRVFINPTGNDGMAKGGSGDVLTGLIGGLLAQGCTALDAACCGAFLHGLAGDFAREELGRRGMMARDILDQVPDAFRVCELDEV